MQVVNLRAEPREGGKDDPGYVIELVIAVDTQDSTPLRNL